MAIDLSPGYKPSADEELMSPKQVASVDAWKSSRRRSPARACASQPSEADDRSSREGDQTDRASAESEARIMVQNRERSRCCCSKRNGPFRSLTMTHPGLAKIPASRSI